MYIYIIIYIYTYTSINWTIFWVDCGIIDVRGIILQLIIHQRCLLCFGGIATTFSRLERIRHDISKKFLTINDYWMTILPTIVMVGKQNPHCYKYWKKKTWSVWPLHDWWLLDDGWSKQPPLQASSRVRPARSLSQVQYLPKSQRMQMGCMV